MRKALLISSFGLFSLVAAGCGGEVSGPTTSTGSTGSTSAELVPNINIHIVPAAPCEHVGCPKPPPRDGNGSDGLTDDEQLAEQSRLADAAELEWKTFQAQQQQLGH